MPEGPEIRQQADRLAKALVGRDVEEMFFAFDELQPYTDDLKGTQVTEVKSHGKALVTTFSNGLSIYSHNQLYGRWYVRKRDSYPKTNRQLRLAIHNQRYSALLYSASDIEVLDEEGISSHPFLQKLGPDLLDESTTEAQVLERYQSKTFRRRGLSGLLLNQHFLAGLGNYLRSEILFVSGVHPSLRPTDCSEKQLEALAHASLTLTQQSYETKGITNDLERVAKLKEQGQTRRQYRHYVFGRANKPCYDCNTPIEKHTFSGRRLYLCPTCQPDPKAD